MTPATLTADLSLALMALDSGEIPAARAVLATMLDSYSQPEAEPVNTATSKQTWALRCATGRDFRHLPLTYDEAHDLLESLNDTGKGDYRGQTIRTTASADRYQAKRCNTASIPF